MLNTTQLQFLVLLRAGLWNKLENIDELIHPEAYQANGNKVISRSGNNIINSNSDLSID